jgi:hypothetical protein
MATAPRHLPRLLAFLDRRRGDLRFPSLVTKAHHRPARRGTPLSPRGPLPDSQYAGAGSVSCAGGVFLADPPRRDGKASLGTLISAEAQGGYARHGPSALTSRAPNPVSTAFDNLIRELGAKSSACSWRLAGICCCLSLASWRGAEKVAIESDTCCTSGSNDCPRYVELLHKSALGGFF